MNDDIPCRVTADLRRYEQEQFENERYAEEFDETNDDHVKAVTGDDLCAVILQLLLTRNSIKQARGSFGADPERVAKYVEEDLDRLYERVKELWEAM